MKAVVICATVALGALIGGKVEAGEKMAGPTLVPASPVTTSISCVISSVGLNVVRNVKLEILDHTLDPASVVTSISCGNLVKKGSCTAVATPSINTPYSCVASSIADDVGPLRGTMALCNDTTGCHRIPIQ